MTGPENYRRAEELAGEAHRLFGREAARPLRAVWAAVAQAHAMLALAAATAVGALGPDHRAWPTPRRPGSDPAAVIIDA